MKRKASILILLQQQNAILHTWYDKKKLAVVVLDMLSILLAKNWIEQCYDSF